MINKFKLGYWYKLKYEDYRYKELTKWNKCIKVDNNGGCLKNCGWLNNIYFTFFDYKDFHESKENPIKKKLRMILNDD